MKKNQLTTTKSIALTLGKTKSLMNITKKLLEGKSKKLTSHDDITLIGDLMWEKETQEWIDWHEAMAYAKNLRLGGYDDWRLPTIEELEDVVRLCGGELGNESENIDNEAYQASYKEKGFTSHYYWSSTTYASYISLAWLVDFSTGTTKIIKSDTYGMRCVRQNNKSK